jgi:hypothetical protein
MARKREPEMVDEIKMVPEPAAVAVAERKYESDPSEREPAVTYGTAVETPAPAAPAPNGTQPVPQPAVTPKRRPANPDAPRPFYLVCARGRDTGRIRVLMEELTIGRAVKMVPRVAHLVERDEIGPVVLRCKIA